LDGSQSAVQRSAGIAARLDNSVDGGRQFVWASPAARERERDEACASWRRAQIV